MDPFFPAIWNVFHDGSIAELRGGIPGTIEVFVDIEYLRERFQSPGEFFVLKLQGCAKFSFQHYDADTPIDELAAITAVRPQILNAEMRGRVCRVFSDSGTLDIDASTGSIHLDSGPEVTLDELLEVAKSYWDEWELKSGDET